MLPKLPPICNWLETVAKKVIKAKMKRKIQGIGARNQDFNSNRRNVKNIRKMNLGKIPG